MTHYCGSEWIAKQRSYWKGHEHPMSELGRDVADILGATFAGIYHLNTCTLQKAHWGNDHTISIVIYGELATYDDCDLTDLVLLCFMLNVRLEVRAAAHKYIQLNFSRVGRWGFFRDEHPKLDEYIRIAHVRLADILRAREER